MKIEDYLPTEKEIDDLFESPTDDVGSIFKYRDMKEGALLVLKIIREKG